MHAKKIRAEMNPPKKLVKLKSIRLLTSEGETIDIIVDQGFLIEHSNSEFKFEVKIEDGLIRRNGKG